MLLLRNSITRVDRRTLGILIDVGRELRAERGARLRHPPCTELGSEPLTLLISAPRKFKASDPHMASGVQNTYPLTKNYVSTVYQGRRDPRSKCHLSNRTHRQCGRSLIHAVETGPTPMDPPRFPFCVVPASNPTSKDLIF